MAGYTKGVDVTDIPRHREVDDITGARAQAPSKPRWVGYAICAVIALVLVLVVVLHLTGVVGPGAN